MEAPPRLRSWHVVCNPAVAPCHLAKAAPEIPLPPPPRSGLHDGDRDEAEAYCIDLENPAGDPINVLQRLKEAPQEEKAKYTRLAVFGFAVVRHEALKAILEELPAVKQIAIPDRPKDVMIVDYLRGLTASISRSGSRSAPCSVMFPDGTEVPLEAAEDGWP
mmetsp:Transcript_20810/g.48657  ORF Transcript_20810/g.48657 Transcript_20810/m.48657 type:complete len:162 (+) Transcript_20810:37-522(+)